jgi:hypothetical protein
VVGRNYLNGSSHDCWVCRCNNEGGQGGRNLLRSMRLPGARETGDDDELAETMVNGCDDTSPGEGAFRLTGMEVPTHGIFSKAKKKIGVSRVPLLERGHSADAGRNSELRGQNNDAGGGGGSEVLARSPTFVDC